MSKTKIVFIGILAGFTAFIGGKLAWSLFPWHHGLFEKVENTSVLMQTLEKSTPNPGLYVLPVPPDFTGKTTEEIQEVQKNFLRKKMQGMSAFLVVQPNGSLPFGRSILFTLWGNIFSGIVLVYLLNLLPKETRTTQKTLFIILVVLVGSVSSQMPNFAWWGFPDKFILVAILDQVFAWVLAGFVIFRLEKFQLPTTTYTK